MNETFEPEDGLIARLRALGQMPVDSATQSRHLTAMAEAAAAPTLFGTLGNRLRVAVALVVGFMLGTTGLASAGALGPLQPIASTTLEKVGINVPHPDDAGTARYRGEECEEVSYKNRGSYLKAIREKYGKDSPQLEAAKASRCGMPIGSEGDEGDDADELEGTESESGKPEGKGKPENPGKSDEKGNSSEKSGNADNSNKANKGAAADDNAKVSDNAEAECAGGADVAQTAPPSTAPAMPECAEAQKDANAPEGPSADQKPSDESSSDDDDDNEDETQDTTATEQVPSDADASSDGS